MRRKDAKTFAANPGRPVAAPLRPLRAAVAAGARAAAVAAAARAVPGGAAPLRRHHVGAAELRRGAGQPGRADLLAGLHADHLPCRPPAQPRGGRPRPPSGISLACHVVFTPL